MASWLQSQFRRAEELLETVDRTAKTVAVVREPVGSPQNDADQRAASLEPPVSKKFPQKANSAKVPAGPRTSPGATGTINGRGGQKGASQTSAEIVQDESLVAPEFKEEGSAGKKHSSRLAVPADGAASDGEPGGYAALPNGLTSSSSPVSLKKGPSTDGASRDEKPREPAEPAEPAGSAESAGFAEAPSAADDQSKAHTGGPGPGLGPGPGPVLGAGLGAGLGLGLAGVEEAGSDRNGAASDAPSGSSDAEHEPNGVPGSAASVGSAAGPGVNGAPGRAASVGSVAGSGAAEDVEVPVVASASPSASPGGEFFEARSNGGGVSDGGGHSGEEEARREATAHRHSLKTEGTEEGGQRQGGGKAEEPGAPKALAVQRELDEARGLLQKSSAKAQSKEARLAKICQQLSARVQEYKAENAQLEELLSQERLGRGSIDTSVKALHQQLAAAQAESRAAEAGMVAALSAKNSELEAMAASLADAKRQGAVLEGRLASLQANTEVLTKTRDVTEARMIQALREELAAAERRLEDERGAHAATRQAAVEREVQLEQRMTDGDAALTRMQRFVDERTQKASDLEEKISLLEVECASLNQELQDMEARHRREHKRPADDGTGSAQVQAWREEAERARALQHEAENRLVAKEAESQKLRVELEARKREIDSGSVQAQAELEKRFRELTELLYLKQTQLEAMSSEKQAALLQLEKETRRFREAKAQAEREKMRRTAVSGEDDDLQSFQSLNLNHRGRGVSPSINQAAKLLDRGAVTAGRFLWRRPLARLALVIYLVFVHLMLMYFQHRLQEQAEVLMSMMVSTQDAEAASGLVKPVHSRLP